MSNSDEPADRLISYAERKIAKYLLRALNAAAISDEIRESPEFDEVLVGLDGFIPEVLAEVDQKWSERSGDGIVPFVAFKIGERAIKIFGTFYTLPRISDQTMYLRMQVDHAGEQVSWFECKLGIGTHGNGPAKYRNHGERMAVIYSPDGHEDSDGWIYMVAYGTRDD